jgi:hypothetical protein
MADTPTLFVCHGDDGDPRMQTVIAHSRAILS